MAVVSIARADPIAVVAAENFYGDIVEQIGGSGVEGRQHSEQSRPGPAPVRGERCHRTPHRASEAVRV